MEAPDEQLMLAYRDGDAGAFETLYARHRGALYRFVLRSLKGVTSDRAIAEELFQEAWIRVIEARERYAELMADPRRVDDILAAGAERIRPIAEATMAEVREKMGLR